MERDYVDDQHSVARSLLLHLLPGVLIGLCYFALRPLLAQAGYPSIMALMAALLLVLLPLELGYLLYQGRRRNGRLSLAGVVRYRDAIPAWQYLLWVPALFVLVGIIFTVLRPLDGLLKSSLFAWMPAMESGLQPGFSKSALMVTYLMVGAMGALVGPTVEELYFRGYLLPRMQYAGKLAPLLHSLLFAMYHVFTPWMVVTRTLGILPLAYAVQRRNLYVSVLVHILLNFIDVAAGVAFIASMT